LAGTFPVKNDLVMRPWFIMLFIFRVLNKNIKNCALFLGEKISNPTFAPALSDGVKVAPQILVLFV
jgi:hypothetical protein